MRRLSVMPWPTSTQEAQPGERSSAKLDRGSRSLRRIPGTPPTSRDSTGLGRGEAGEFYLRLRDVEATLSSTDPRPRVRAAQARPGPLLANRVARACASPDAGACWSGRRLRSSHFRLPLGWWPCRLIMCQFGRLSTKRGTRPAARWRSTVRYRRTASKAIRSGCGPLGCAVRRVRVGVSGAPGVGVLVAVSPSLV